MSEQVFKENDEIDIFELLGKIWKGKFSIAMFIIAFFCVLRKTVTKEKDGFA